MTGVGSSSYQCTSHHNSEGMIRVLIWARNSYERRILTRIGKNWCPVILRRPFTNHRQRQRAARRRRHLPMSTSATPDRDLGSRRSELDLVGHNLLSLFKISLKTLSQAKNLQAFESFDIRSIQNDVSKDEDARQTRQ